MPRRRVLPLKPDNTHYYGRVISVRQGAKVEVDFMYQGQVFNQYTTAPHWLHSTLRANDPVLLKMYHDPAEASDDGHEDYFPIVVVYNEKEEAELRSRGVLFPDCPPEKLPDGYYG